MSIKKLLIANRGEIALRIIRTCRELGIGTVAVYSEADKSALHVLMADESVQIGPPQAAESYLSIPRIIDAAKSAGADALHPGYGFLSERPELAESCRDAGLIFVGPSPEAMRAVGDKIAAKQLAVASGVPIVPGFFERGASAQTLRQEAKRIGFPVMIKASAGGGGRGMRVVRDSKDFDDALAVASDEALKAFGDGTMMVEKLIERPRHIEVQVLADRSGTVACLFERECSIQRRHQKLIEEAPSPYIHQKPELWDRMRGAASKIAAAARYENAGTVEFVVDSQTGAFYFLEVNARLQVEHPVTEAITGLDLVHEQLRIAQGEPIGFDSALVQGDRSRISGHAIEVRVIAEDPAKGFLPSVGHIAAWSTPRDSRIRVDAGFEKGMEISRFYDSLVAKVIARGSERSEAISRLRSALMDFHVLGVKTNLGFLCDLTDHPDFRSGDFDTSFLATRFKDWIEGPPPDELLALTLTASGDARTAEAGRSQSPAWSLADGFRNARKHQGKL